MQANLENELKEIESLYTTAKEETKNLKLENSLAKPGKKGKKRNYLEEFQIPEGLGPVDVGRKKRHIELNREK